MEVGRGEFLSLDNASASAPSSASLPLSLSLSLSLFLSSFYFAPKSRYTRLAKVKKYLFQVITFYYIR